MTGPESEQRHTSRRLFWARRSHHQRKKNNQETNNPETLLATSKPNGIINHINEPEPPIPNRPDIPFYMTTDKK